MQVTVLLMFAATATTTKACQFQSPSYETSDNYTSVNQHTQAIVPQYAFSCHGKVTSWVVCTAGSTNRLSIQLQIWRPSGDLGGYYSMVGYNELSVDSNNDICTSVEVADSKQITVWSGDVVGFYVERRGSSSDRDKTILIQEEDWGNVTVYYEVLRRKGQIREHYAIGEEAPSESTRDTEELTLSLIGAPLLAAVVERETDGESGGADETTAQMTSSTASTSNTATPTPQQTGDSPVISTTVSQQTSSMSLNMLYIPPTPALSPAITSTSIPPIIYMYAPTSVVGVPVPSSAGGLDMKTSSEPRISERVLVVTTAATGGATIVFVLMVVIVAAKIFCVKKRRKRRVRPNRPSTTSDFIFVTSIPINRLSRLLHFPSKRFSGNSNRYSATPTHVRPIPETDTVSVETMP